MGLLGIAGLGSGYMIYRMMATRNRTQNMAPSFDQFGQPIEANFHGNETVIKRMQNTMLYFGSGIGITSLSVMAFRHSALARINPLWFLIPSIGCLLGTIGLDYNRQSFAKHACWAGFCASTGMSLMGLINFAGQTAIMNAFGATGIMMGLLGFYAYNSPYDFMSMGGYLSVGLFGLLGASMINLIYPSPLMFTFQLYAGLLLFGGFVLYDTQKIIADAQHAQEHDPIRSSVGIYLDAINIFTKFLIIFSRNKK